MSRATRPGSLEFSNRDAPDAFDACPAAQNREGEPRSGRRPDGGRRVGALLPDDCRDDESEGRPSNEASERHVAVIVRRHSCCIDATPHDEAEHHCTNDCENATGHDRHANRVPFGVVPVPQTLDRHRRSDHAHQTDELSGQLSH